MKGSQVKQLLKLEKQYGEDYWDFNLRDVEAIYKECPQIAALRQQLQDYIVRHGPEPPRFYQYGEDESTRRWQWALQWDKKAQALFHRLIEALKQEAEIRGAEREKKAKDEVLENWEWLLGEPEREAKAAAELEERKRKMEAERQERERKWEEERAARQQQQWPGAYGSNERQSWS